MSSATAYSLRNARLAAYLLALMALFWLAELGSFVPRSLTLNIPSINRLYSTSDYYRDDAEDERADMYLAASEMALEHPECEGKERLLEILLKAGKEEISVEDCGMLPTWGEVTRLYGEEPIVYGLETCGAYRDGLRKGKEDGTISLRPDPRVAGLFDTGTNAFTDSLDLNFRHLDDKLEYMAPGGKHTLLRDRKSMREFNTNNSTKTPTFFPIVLIRDPFRWMASMVSCFSIQRKRYIGKSQYFVIMAESHIRPLSRL